MMISAVLTRLLGGLLAVLLLMAPAMAQQPASPTEPAATEPAKTVTHVHVGSFINQVFDLNLRENKVTADLYVWFRWQGDLVNPPETFEVINGKVEEKQFQPTRDVMGWHYAYGRVLVTFNKYWDVTRFPMDEQVIDLIIEDADADENEMVFIADTKNTNYSKEVRIPGYQIVKSNAAVTQRVYSTNYGDISLPTDNRSVYSRYVHSLTIERPGYGYFVKLFITTMISACVAFLAFLVKPIDLDPRFGLGVGALFAVVASAFIISAELPQSNEMTLADQMNVTAMLVILASLVQSALSLKIFERNEAASRVLDRASFVGFPVAYLGICLWLMTH